MNKPYIIAVDKQIVTGHTTLSGNNRVALLPPFAPVWVGAFIVLAGLSEFAGALGPTVGATRRYDGPMGKSDRAAAVGAIALLASFAPLPPAAAWLMPLLALLTAWTVVRRVRAALQA